MTIIVRLTTGEDIIGEVAEETEAHLSIEHPMVIVSSRDDNGGAMKLRDFFLLSDETTLALPWEMILTDYTPTYTMQEYYKKASYYSRTYTKVLIDDQIRYATTELEHMISEESKAATKLTDVLMKVAGSRLQ